MTSTIWGTESGAAPLYSDWKVSFTAQAAPSKDDNNSVATQSLSVEDSVQSSEESPPKEQQKEEKSQDKVFSIHRNMVGPKSQFFTKSFGGEESSTVILLPSGLPAHSFASVVDAFEILLDYCYMGDIRDNTLVTENAVAMFCLCNYFEMESEICEKVNDFIKSDLTQENVSKYYQNVKDLRLQATPVDKFSTVLNAEPIMKMVIDICHASPSTLDSQTDLFKIADLTLFLSIGAVLAEDNETSTEASKTWSENLTAFFDAYDEEHVLDLKDSFRTLTAENILHEVSPKVALRLLEHERKHGLDSLTRRVKKEKEAADGGNISPMSSNDDTEDGTVSTTADSDLDVVLEEELLGTEKITSLQQRCIKALCESNWYGKENDIEQKRGKLIHITTPSVLETLLIDSVTGERALTAKMEEMTTEREAEKKLLKSEVEAYEFKKEETKVEVALEKQKQQALQHELDKVQKELENLKASSKRVQEKSASVHAELCKANAVLEADLEKEKKRSNNLQLKYGAMKRAQGKIETDREMYELSVKDTIKRLDALTSFNETGGLGHLMFLVSAFSDRSEMTQMRQMLQEVVKDPLTYERNYLKVEERDEQPDEIIQIGDQASFLYD